jgi:Tfp pilus assembly protein PilN
MSKKSWQKSGAICETACVSKHGRHKNNLYYLMPGMGRGARKRFWRNMFLGIFVGLFVSALMWLLFSYTSRQ